jgi:hypothetical protein
MTEIALRAPACGAWRRLAETSRQVLLGIAEGFAAARRYERLAAMSDTELARRGLRREDVGWFAMFGERRPR